MLATQHHQYAPLGAGRTIADAQLLPRGDSGRCAEGHAPAVPVQLYDVGSTRMIEKAAESKHGAGNGPHFCVAHGVVVAGELAVQRQGIAAENDGGRRVAGGRVRGAERRALCGQPMRNTSARLCTMPPQSGVGGRGARDRACIECSPQQLDDRLCVDAKDAVHANSPLNAPNNVVTRGGHHVRVGLHPGRALLLKVVLEAHHVPKRRRRCQEHGRAIITAAATAAAARLHLRLPPPQATGDQKYGGRGPGAQAMHALLVAGTPAGGDSQQSTHTVYDDRGDRGRDTRGTHLNTDCTALHTTHTGVGHNVHGATVCFQRRASTNTASLTRVCAPPPSPASDGRRCSTKRTCTARTA